MVCNRATTQAVRGHSPASFYTPIGSFYHPQGYDEMLGSPLKTIG